MPADFFKQQFSAAQEAIYSRAIDNHLRDGRAGRGAGDRGTGALARLRRSAGQQGACRPRDAVVAGGASRSGRGPAGHRRCAAGVSAARGAPAGKRVRPAKHECRRRRPRPPIPRRRPSGSDSTLLAYWVTNDRLFIWVVGADGARAGTDSRRRPVAADRAGACDLAVGRGIRRRHRTSGPARAPATRGTDTDQGAGGGADAPGDSFTTWS